MGARSRVTVSAVALLGALLLLITALIGSPVRAAARDLDRPGAERLGRVGRDVRVPVEVSPARSSATPSGARAAAPVLRGYRRAVVTDLGGRGACLARVAHAGGPLLTVLGASFTAGVGPNDPRRAWSVDLARTLGWRAVIVAVPGVGYVRHGQHRVGPLSRLVRLAAVARLRPAVLVVQAGHDDWHSAPARERRRAWSLFRTLHHELPHATLAAMTVFTAGHRHRRQLDAINRAIVAGARSGDRSVLVMNPILQDWDFRRASTGQLHPSAQGDRQIAAFAMAALGERGVRGVGDRDGVAPICDLLPAGPLPRPGAFGLRSWHGAPRVRPAGGWLRPRSPVPAPVPPAAPSVGMPPR